MRQGCILCVIKNQPARQTKYFLFQDNCAHPPREAVTARALNTHVPDWFCQAVTGQCNQSVDILAKNFAPTKHQRIKAPKFQKVFKCLRVSCGSGRRTCYRDTTETRAQPNGRRATGRPRHDQARRRPGCHRKR